jgi:indole-3-glycerol phosphate synthase
MSDILSRIAEYKRADVAERVVRTPQSEMDALAMAAGPVRGFRMALTRPHSSLSLIAEIKKASPSKGLIREDFDPAALARAYQAGGANCLSVLTDGPSFQGADEYLTRARDACALPCLRKDFLVHPWQVAESRALGADAILIIMAMVDDQLARDLMSEAAHWDMDALVEVHDEEELERAGLMGATLIGVNNRDLKTFTVDLAVTEHLAPLAMGALVVAESGINTSEDMDRLCRAGATAMLVGESLMRQADVEAATRALLGD